MDPEKFRYDKNKNPYSGYDMWRMESNYYPEPNRMNTQGHGFGHGYNGYDNDLPNANGYDRAYQSSPASNLHGQNENEYQLTSTNKQHYDKPGYRRDAPPYPNNVQDRFSYEQQEYAQRRPGYPGRKMEMDNAGTGMYDPEYDNYDDQYDDNIGYAEVVDEKSRPKVMDYFGIYSSVPTLTILKLFTMLILIAMVEITVYTNMVSDRFLGEVFDENASILFGVGLIGVFLGFLFRYIEFEAARLKWYRLNLQKTDLKSYLTIIFLCVLFIFIIIEVISELLFARGILFLIDMISILCMTFGTYTVLSGKRYVNIFTILFLFLILLIGSDFEPNLPMMMFTAVLILVYLELSDGICRLQEYVLKYHEMAEEDKPRTRASVDIHLDSFTMQFVQNLGIFVIFTILVSSIMLAIFYVYPFIAPIFIGQNLELQSVYSILPIISLLFFIFIIIYLFTPNLRPTDKSSKES